MNIKDFEVIVPSMDNPFGQLKMELELPFKFELGQKFPPEMEEANIEFSEKTTNLLRQLTLSIIEDVQNVK